MDLEVVENYANMIAQRCQIEGDNTGEWLHAACIMLAGRLLGKRSQIVGEFNQGLTYGTMLYAATAKRAADGE